MRWADEVSTRAGSAAFNGDGAPQGDKRVSNVMCARRRIFLRGVAIDLPKRPGAS